MDYEKKYKEALERAKNLYENSNGMILKKWVEQVFPELAESEDEKIRKELIAMVKEDWPGREDVIAWLEKQGGQKPVEWSNEDEYNQAFIIELLNGIEDFNDKEYEKKCRRMAEWMKKISYQTKYVCNEIDLMKLNNIISILDGKHIMRDDKKSLINWLKSFKDRCMPQPKQEWSDKDKEMLKDIVDRLERLRIVTAGSEKELCKDISWLKSLRPQKQWKPTEEQMEAVELASNCGGLGVNAKALLKELLEQLKELKV